MSQSDMHAPADLLAMRAMGDELPEALARHVASCERCQSELEQWSHLVDSGRSSSPDDVPQPPRPQVWDGIVGELGLQPVLTDPTNSATSSDSTLTAQSSDRRAGSVVSLTRPRQRWSTSWLVAASAAGIVAGVAATAIGNGFMQSDSPAPVAAPPVVANATLDALPDHEGAGRAEIVKTERGSELVVDVADLSGGEGFYEVWLIDPETFQMIGLGALTEGNGKFPIPNGLDLSRYTVVDVSLEPFDGDPVHSRDSVVRGELNA